jgi:hypothetical protein
MPRRSGAGRAAAAARHARATAAQVRLRLADAHLDVGVRTAELISYLGLGLAAHLAADSPAFRAVA